MYLNNLKYFRFMVKLGHKIRFYTTLTTQIGCIKANRKYLRYLVIQTETIDCLPTGLLNCQMVTFLMSPFICIYICSHYWLVKPKFSYLSEVNGIFIQRGAFLNDIEAGRNVECPYLLCKTKQKMLQ